MAEDLPDFSETSVTSGIHCTTETMIKEFEETEVSDPSNHMHLVTPSLVVTLKDNYDSYQRKVRISKRKPPDPLEGFIGKKLIVPAP